MNRNTPEYDIYIVEEMKKTINYFLNQAEEEGLDLRHGIEKLNNTDGISPEDKESFTQLYEDMIEDLF